MWENNHTYQDESSGMQTPEPQSFNRAILVQGEQDQYEHVKTLGSFAQFKSTDLPLQQR